MKSRSSARMVRSKSGAPTVAMVLALSALTGCATASAQDDDRVKAGLEVWKSSGCADCHGSFANGEKQRDEAPPGADLRTSRLSSAELKEVISCGRPGGAGMPAFDEGAYKVRPCGGQNSGHSARQSLSHATYPDARPNRCCRDLSAGAHRRKRAHHANRMPRLLRRR